MKRVLVSLAVAVLFSLPSSAAGAGLSLPVDGYYDRQTFKGFGAQVTPQFQAAHPEVYPRNGYKNNYTGYHAAVDLEFAAPAEAGLAVPVTAVADGTVIYRGDVSGYGGLIVLRHTVPESVTTLYGHVRLADAPVHVGQTVTAGQTLGFLGAPFSGETSGARKHLHFGVHKGSALDINGYEQSPAALQAEWHGPNAWLASHGLVRPSALPTLTPTSTPAAAPTALSAAAPVPEPPRGFWGSLGHFFESLWEDTTG